MKTFSTAEELSKKVAEAQEKEILSQLNEFVSRGIIVVETMGPTLTQEPFSANPYEVKVRTAVRLKIKDQEYIEEIEKELKYLRDWKRRLENMFESEKAR